ncbi:NAD(P)-binding domain-containing protein [Mycobacterium sp. NPDC050551]|uniref:NAD(P)-dependent oxidoreductase n=1 Tax=Mycobacterium sp. NPDC050551 TaxID=3155407 RepID=UPI003423EAF7
MSSVTVLGLGPMGQALTGALLDAGHRVTVWNRTASKADGVLARGAMWAGTPALAVAASDLTLVNVVDHGATDAVLDIAGDAVAGHTVVGLSSDTPAAARATATVVDKLGGRYLDGSIMTPTDTIGTRDASILFAGPRPEYDAHRDVLEALGTTSWVGAEVGRAAAYDMALLDFFWTSIGGVLHAFSVAGANGITPRELLPHAKGIVAILSPIVDELAGRVEDDRHGDVTAPVSSLVASLAHLISASRDAGVDTAALEALRRHADAAVADGYGGDEISRVGAYVTG